MDSYNSSALFLLDKFVRRYLVNFVFRFISPVFSLLAFAPCSDSLYSSFCSILPPPFCSIPVWRLPEHVQLSHRPGPFEPFERRPPVLPLQPGGGLRPLAREKERMT